MQFRSLFNKIFGREKQAKDVTALKLLNGYANAYTPFSGNSYDDSTVRDCIDTIAKHFGKMRPKHVIKENGKIIKNANDRLNYLLSNRPNELMTTSEFLEKIIAQYYTYNNAFIYIKWDMALENIEALYPLDFPMLEILEDRENNLYARFTFGGGERTVINYNSLIHIRRHFNRDELFGDDNSKIMIEDLSTLKAAKASIVNAVKSFTSLRGYLKWLTTMRPNDMKKTHDDFVNTYATNNPSGIASIDNKVEFHELTTKVTTFNSQQMSYVRDNIYKHFGLNENIIMGKYTEDEYIAFYESVIEPVAVKLAQEMTDKMFTRRERAFGNEIILESNRLNFMSVASKIKVCETLIPTGGMTINEIRAIFGYAGIEGGDERLISLNFVKAKDQSLYQTGTDDNSLKGGEKMGKMEMRMALLEPANNDDKNKQLVEGYAAVFNQRALIWESEWSGWKYMEVIDRNAFNGADMNDTVFKYNHGDVAMILARASNNTLTMNTDDKGLRISADIIDTNNGTDVYKLIKRGDLNKMSFAFTVKSERTEVDKENKIYTRTITAFDKIYDVAVVDFPAYDGTSIQARSKEYFVDLEKDLQEKQRRKKLLLMTYL